MTDPIADFLTRIRNGLSSDKDVVDIPASKFKAELARILTEQGYVESYAVEPGRVAQDLRVTLKYTEDRRSAIQGLRRVSRPGQRTYRGHENLPKVQGGMGTIIMSTSHGVMTGHQARQSGVGGEVVAEIW